MKFSDQKSLSYSGFFRALVVNNGFDKIDGKAPTADPNKRGRVQVRVLGVHTFKTANAPKSGDGIPDSHLPWAEQAAPLFGGMMKDDTLGTIGFSSVPPTGSWVWVFFDNEDASFPVYFASIPGNNQITKIDTVIRTPSGHSITLKDEKGKESIDITFKNSVYGVLIKDGKDKDGNTTPQITIHGGVVAISASSQIIIGSGTNGYLVSSHTKTPIETANGTLTPLENILC